MNKKLLTPFDSKRYIGSVCQVDPETVKINLPQASAACAGRYAGNIVPGGQVGEFVFIEGEGYAILGRITQVRLPEKERLTIEPRNTEMVSQDSNPIGFVQLLATLKIGNGVVEDGIVEYPRIGQYVYSAHPSLIKHMIERTQEASTNHIVIAQLSHDSSTTIKITPKQLFGRHCAVLGATGGGKSWTVARVTEEIDRLGGKAILIDATGEFSSMGGKVRHIYLGGHEASDGKEYVCFPYTEFSDMDIFSLFQPSMGAQAPKLREALKSLKLIHIDSGLSDGGLLKKAGKPKKAIDEALRIHYATIHASGAEYDISMLAQQIGEECIWPTGRDSRGNNDGSIWGGLNQGEYGYVTGLIGRIESIINSAELRCVFQTDGISNVTTVLEEFLQSDGRVLRISLENLSFEHHARELIANAMGRYLLRRARQGIFKKKPTVVILDEAHQFLNKRLGDETNQVTLDAFGLIAKEGRKYGLTCVLATQRPRDIPDDVLSQMGMFIVHRLINELDRRVVEKACGHLDGAAAAFLPTLGQGEAILVGADFPMPMPVKIICPINPPKSDGPSYSEWWCCGSGDEGIN